MNKTVENEVISELFDGRKYNSAKRCIVHKCPAGRNRKSRNKKPGTHLTLFLFPHDPKMHKIWCDSLQVPEWIVKSCKKLFVCSNHFDESQIFSVGSKLRLHDNVIPHLKEDSAENEREEIKTSSVSVFSKMPAHLDMKVDSDCENESIDIDLPSKLEKDPLCTNIVNLADTFNDIHPESNTKIDSLQRDSLIVKKYSKSTPMGRKQSNQNTKYNKINNMIMITEKNRTIRNLRKSNIRYKKKIVSLETTINALKNGTNVNRKATKLLQDRRDRSVLKLLFERYAANESKKKINRIKYPLEIKAFSVYLYSYSRKAYEYVRSTFNHALPEGSRVRAWSSEVLGQTDLDVDPEKHQDHTKKDVCQNAFSDRNDMNETEYIDYET